MMTKHTTSTNPKIPKPMTFAMTIATSQETSRADASVSKTHCNGGSDPSSGILPSGVNHFIADTLKSNLLIYIHSFINVLIA